MDSRNRCFYAFFNVFLNVFCNFSVPWHLMKYPVLGNTRPYPVQGYACAYTFSFFTSNEESAASFASYEWPCYFEQWAPAYPPSSWPWQPNTLQNPRLDKSRRGRVWCHRSIAPGNSGAWALASTYFLWPHAMQHNYWRTCGQPALNAAAN